MINSQEHGPYAVKTLLGWVINGPLGGCCKGVETATVIANRISLVNLKELLVSEYNTDFYSFSGRSNSELFYTCYRSQMEFYVNP